MRNCFITMRCLLVFSLFIIYTSISSCSTSQPKKVTTVTIPVTDGTYEGYRLSVTNINIKRKKKKSTIIDYTLFNTGRNNISIIKSAPDKVPILIEFDHSLEEAELQTYKSQIIANIFNQDTHIASGKSLKDRSMKLNTKAAVHSDEDDTTFTINVGKNSSSSSERYFDKNYCPDLHIDSIRILKLTKKWVTIEYTLSNTGKGPASLSGETDSEEDNLFVRAHLSGAKRLSRGAVAIGGHYITDKDVLEAGEKYIGIFRIDVRKRTRYTSVLILELDPFSAVRECDETNNQRPIILE